MAENLIDAEAIQAWLVSKLSERLGIEAREVDIREPLASYGLGSTEAVGLAGELAAWLQRKLSPALVYEYPTIEALARYLAASPDASALPSETATDLAANEPIAIIGIGCRFPGAEDPAAFWRLLRDGVDAIGEVPADRFDYRAFYDPDPATPGKMNTRWGGFLNQVDRFDANFFGISPREAARMDPQQRLLLEVSWEALQDAGQAPGNLAGSHTGVFIGIATNDYGRLQWSDLARIDAYAGTGNALSIAANRISYVLDFHGPSIAIDTACSSSLVAVHLACSSLRKGESTLALAGGVNLILSPAIAINFTKAGAMAADGRCKTFDARADGYVRSEGAGVVVLKPLARAVADGDPIYAVIRGSAVNQDGRSNGLMAPNPAAQEAVLREAYRQAAVSPGTVQYVEAHGTGTLLGDPIEVQALGAVMGIDRPPERPCALGSVKTNLGHLEAAAGIAGLIKVALALRHHEIPPSLHFEKPNPLIPFSELPLRVQTALGPWPAESGAALAGVSSFGFGGTNAHVVLEEAPPVTTARAGAKQRSGAHLLPLSARSPEALQSLARSYQDLLSAPASTSSLRDVCYTASARLAHHDHRLAVTGSSSDQLVESLAAILQGEARPGLSSGRKLSAQRRKLVFVFPGQGSQWFGMGRRLIEEEAAFREVIERCDLAMRPYGDWSLLAELTATDVARSRLNEIDIVQPALFAVQIALAALWRSWGIEPQAVVGHSLGEVAAAHVAGVLSLDDAVRVICHRSHLFKRIAGQGAMMAAELSIKEARRVIEGCEDRVSVAVSNGPTATVLSGDPGALAEIADRLQRADVYCRMVDVDFASHSPQVEPLGADLVQALDGLEPRDESVPIYSTVTGQVSHGLEYDAFYWARNMREPVLFSTAVQALAAEGHDIFLEISPHPVLLSAIQQGLDHLGKDGVVLPSLRREEDERTVLLGSLGALYTAGYEFDWSRIDPAGAQCVQLPSYPWQRERHWHEPTDADANALAAPVSRRGTGTHPLLGWHFTSPLLVGTHFWETTLDKNSLPYLEEHSIQGVALLPASAYMEMALAAAVEVFGTQPVELRDIEFRTALFLPEGGTRRIQLTLSQDEDRTAVFHIYSCAGGAAPAGKSWLLHATGKVGLQQDNAVVSWDAEPDTLTETSARRANEISGQDYYRSLGESGIHYGSMFQGITRLWPDKDDVVGEVQVPDGGEADLNGFHIHPAILDAGLQVFGAAVGANDKDRKGIYLPTRIDLFRVNGRPGRHLWGHAQLRHREPNATIGDVRFVDQADRVEIKIQGLRFEYLSEDAQPAAAETLDRWLYQFAWLPKELAPARTAAPASRASWMIFADNGGFGDALCAVLAARGERIIRVGRGEAYAQIDSGHFRIRPDRAEDVHRLFEEALDSAQPGCRGVVHLWSLDAAPPEQTSVAALDAAQTLGCGSVLLLAQELARANSADLPRLWLVTRGAQAAGESPAPQAIAQSPLWGLGRVLAQEHPNFWGGLVDLDPGATLPDAGAQQLGEEISAAAGEDQLAFRHGHRYVGRLLRQSPSPAQAPALRWRSAGTYLISGGLGDLGLLVARWMVMQGARRLILLGRSALPPRASWNSVAIGSRLARQIAGIRELESLGVSVHLAAVDVADEAALRGFLDAFRAEGWPPIRGVVHAAGVLQDGLVVQLDAAAMDAVLRPKVTGGWLLHRLLQDDPLDFFVLFSSAGSLLGQPGQGNYAAANAFLDALAHYRHALGQPALSINWGAWAGEGFADSTGGKRLAARLALLGIGTLAPEQALDILGRLLGQRATQVMAVPVDWKQYREFYPEGSASPLLSELARGEAELLRPVAGTSERRTALIAAAPDERRVLLRSYLSEQVARVLGLSPSKLDLQQPLSQLGMDSLMAVELKNRIAADFKLNIPVVKFLQGFSIDQAVAQMLDQLADEVAHPAMPSLAAAAPPDGDGNAERLLAKLDQLSDEEVGSLLADMLAEEKAGSVAS